MDCRKTFSVAANMFVAPIYCANFCNSPPIYLANSIFSFIREPWRNFLACYAFCGGRPTTSKDGSCVTTRPFYNLLNFYNTFGESNNFCRAGLMFWLSSGATVLVTESRDFAFNLDLLRVFDNFSVKCYKSLITAN